jgi:hypothetical protein
MLPRRLWVYLREVLLERTVVPSRGILRIRGQGPRIKWETNKGGLKRTIEEAVSIARRNGVEIPEDVEFFEAERGQLRGSLRAFLAGKRFETARGPDVDARDDGRIYLQDHYNKYGRIPFRVHPDVLASDEAIVAVFQHEMHELSLMREAFRRSRNGSMNGFDYGIQTSVGRPGNFHDLAWDEADKVVLRMRGQAQ